MPMDEDYGFNRETMGSKTRQKKEQLKLEELESYVKELQSRVEQLEINLTRLELKVERN